MGLASPRGAFLLVLAVVAVVMALAAPAFGSTASPRELALLAAINAVRAEHGLRPIVLEDNLAEGARSHAHHLVGSDTLVHSRGRPLVGEVLAWGVRRPMGAWSVVSRWTASAVHRRILLWPAARRAGVGIAVGEFGGAKGATIVVVRLSS